MTGHRVEWKNDGSYTLAHPEECTAHDGAPCALERTMLAIPGQIMPGIYDITMRRTHLTFTCVDETHDHHREPWEVTRETGPLVSIGGELRVLPVDAAILWLRGGEMETADAFCGALHDWYAARGQAPPLVLYSENAGEALEALDEAMMAEAGWVRATDA